MESAAKRKAANGVAHENEGRPAKRQKGPVDADPEPETAETTTTAGLRFLESLRAAKDKTGRPIATHFLALPDKNKIPEYYDVIKLPIAIDTIEDKLNRGGYTSLAQVESDCKRLVNNAKSFNDKKSLIYEDAERLRKTASNWMTKNNPAYRTVPNYIAVATPVPGEEDVPPGKPIPRAVASTPKSTPAIETPTTDRPRRAAAAAQPSTPAPSKLRQSASLAPEQDDDSSDFTGKNFQQAQEQLVKDLVDYVDPVGQLQIFAPFVNLPSRSLKDYYQLIKHPMSLTAVQKRVRGVIGRNPPTGFTDLKSWNAFEEEMSLIWKNAREYNEDGSDIYNLSLEFEEIFKQRLADAKSKVEEPPQPKLKLNMSAAPKQQLRLKLRQSPGSDPNTPGGRSSATPGVLVDHEALARQKRHVDDGVMVNRSPRPSSAGKQQTPSVNPFTGTRGSAASIPALPRAHKTAGSPPAVNGIKSDVQSPALNAIRPASTASDSQSQRLSASAQTPHPVMPPPLSTPRPTSGSPHPNGPVAQQTGNHQYHPPNHYVPPTIPHYDNLRKTPLKSASEALIQKITLTTAPSLNVPKPFKMIIPANKEKTSQSITLNLPPSHSHLQIALYITAAIEGRPYRYFYQLNNRQGGAPISSGINGTTPGYDGGKKKGELLFDAKLIPGVNRIELEIIAEKDMKDRPDTKDPKEMIEIEKCTIFVNLMRAY